MKATHIRNIERRLARAVETLPEEAGEDIARLLNVDVPELIDAVRAAQGAQRKYCRYCGERRLGLIVASPDDPRVWECRDADGCDVREARKERESN